MKNKSYLISKGMNPNPSLKELKRLLGCVKAFQDICMVIEADKDSKESKYNDIDNCPWQHIPFHTLINNR